MDRDIKMLDDLRERAEAIIRSRKDRFAPSEISDLNKILHELQVHQTELELQNEELREAQGALELAKDNYAALFEYAPDGYVVLDASGMMRRVNDTFAGLLGKEKTEITNKPFSKLIHQADAHRFFSSFKAFFKHPADKSLELRLMDAKGQEIYVRLHGALRLIGQDAGPEDEQVSLEKRLLLSVSDISAEKQAQLKIRRAEKSLEEIILKTPVGVCITDENGILEFVNSAYCGIYGYSQEELMGRHFTLIVPEEYHEQLIRLHDRFFAEQVEIRGEWTVMDKSGNLLTILADAAYIITPDNRPKKATFVVDITERKALERSLKDAHRNLEEKVELRTRELTKKQALLSEAQHLAKMGNWELRLSEDRITCSPEFYSILGVDPPPDLLTRKTFLDRVLPEDRAPLHRILENLRHIESGQKMEFRIRTKENTVKTLYGETGVERDSRGEAVRLFGFVQDISEKKTYEAKIRQLSSAIEASTNLIFITDTSGVIQYVNRAFERVTGYTRDEAVGQTPRILSSGRTPDDTYADLWQSARAGVGWTGEFMNRAKNGQAFWVRVVIIPIRSEIGEVYQYMAIQEDITDHVIVSKKARYLSDRDATTGLLNRKTFLNRVETALENTGESTLILFALDGFKAVNTLYGTAVSDSVLRHVGQLIKTGVSKAFASGEPDFFLSRFGGDEFGLFLEGKTGADALTLAEDIRHRISQGVFEAKEVRLTVSAGLVSHPDHGGTAGELIAKLSLSVQRAKELGRNRCHVYREADQQFRAEQEFYRRKERILSALEEDRFDIWFQPILDLHTNGVEHYEVLVRMRDREGNIVLPGAFIPAAESLGLISEIDRRVISKTFAFQEQMNARGQELTFSMNLSGKEIGDKSLLAFLRQMVKTHEMPPGRMIFEITETAAITDLDKAAGFIRKLREMGFHFSLDDFGVGFTSFLYLKEMDVDYLKIDGAFIRRLTASKQDQGIVRAITSVARGFGIKTVAEFVEQPETMTLLTALDVDYAQGFHIGKPAPKPV